MANRRLHRIKAIKEEQFLQLSKHKILLCKDVLTKNVLELMSCGLTYHESMELYKIVSNIVAPQGTTVLDLVERHQQWFLPTHLGPLDNYMHGGLPSGTITEITGPPGCGKTQFCMMLTSLTIIDALSDQDANSVIYIDTENAFTAKRLSEITRCHLHKKKDGTDVSEIVKNVAVYFESSFKSLIVRLEKLEETIIERNVKLIIVDSIASLARKEFGGHDLITDRNNLLMKEATLLKYYAETFNIAVLVTNQVTTNVSSEFAKESSLVAALGNTWAHAVNTRLMVRCNPDNEIRELMITKSPLCKLSKIYYKIQGEGLVMV